VIEEHHGQRVAIIYRSLEEHESEPEEDRQLDELLSMAAVLRLGS
jgi:hypothetical protein